MFSETILHMNTLSKLTPVVAFIIYWRYKNRKPIAYNNYKSLLEPKLPKAPEPRVAIFKSAAT